MAILDREEYVEQAYLFRMLSERMERQMATQELLAGMKHELLATTKLPLAIDYLTGELKTHGRMAPAMAKLQHYFTPFQTYLMAESENERGKFDLNQSLRILEREAMFRAESPSPQGLFLYQFESLCRNRLNYDKGLTAMAEDPVYDAAWREWILYVRKQVGFVDIVDLIYLRSAWYKIEQARFGAPTAEEAALAPLFGEKEGRIAAANRKRDPLLLFAALHRHLGYPAVPRIDLQDRQPNVLPALVRRVERLESRVKMIDEELKGSFDITKHFVKPNAPPKSDLDELLE